MKGIKNLCLTTSLKNYLVIPISIILILMTMWIQISFAISGQNMGSDWQIALDYHLYQKSLNNNKPNSFYQ